MFHLSLRLFLGTVFFWCGWPRLLCLTVGSMLHLSATLGQQGICHHITFFVGCGHGTAGDAITIHAPLGCAPKQSALVLCEALRHGVYSHKPRCVLRQLGICSNALSGCGTICVSKTLSTNANYPIHAVTQ